MTLGSPAFKPGQPIPKKHTGEGEDVSPALSWSGIPADATGLKEASQGVGVDGKSDFGRPGYGGPMPPKGHGVHHYHFRLYALDGAVGLKPGATKAQLLAAIQGHVLAEAELVGTHERN